MPKVNLYDMHENISKYFEMILGLHTEMITEFRRQLSDDEITALQFRDDLNQIQLAPAVLTVITQFLKTNDIRVIPDNLDKDLDEFERKVAGFKKTGTSMKDLDETVEIN